MKIFITGFLLQPLNGAIFVRKINRKDFADKFIKKSVIHSRDTPIEFIFIVISKNIPLSEAQFPGIERVSEQAEELIF
jgi:hypothetical protein